MKLRSILALGLPISLASGLYVAFAQDSQTPAATPADVASPAAATDAGSAQAQPSQGEYLARVGNCVACHTLPGGEPFAGGLKMAVPGYGFIYVTNITPDTETGIGSYTFEEFDAAMRRGVTKQGVRMYPAMPYPSYAKMSETDMRAMYDYFMKEVKPVKQANMPEEIDSWFNPRSFMAIWNFLFLDDDPYEADPEQSEAWNRGAYLTEGLGHCGACHTPRGWFFQEKGTDSSDDDFLSGAPLDHWSAPSLRSDINSGLGRWTETEIVEFMQLGKNKFGTAFGTMVEVINNSTHFMTDADLQAMATYLKSLPANIEDGDKPYEYNDDAAQKLAALDFSTPGSQVYYEYCVSCHSYDGRGHGLDIPGLAGNPVVLDPHPESLVNLTLNGSLRVVANGRPESFDMPYFRELLTDRQVADVVTFMRTSWGNNAKPVKVEAVADMRALTKPAPNNDVIVLKMK